MNEIILNITLTIFTISVFLGGLWYLDYWFKKKDKERHKKKAG